LDALTALTADERKERAREKSRRWRLEHPGYYSGYNKKYRESHREELAEYQREYLKSYVYKWQTDEEEAARRRAYNRQYHTTHRDKIRARHRANNQTPAGRARCIAYTRKHQSLLWNTPPDVARKADVLVAIWRTIGAICYLCGTTLAPNEVTTEHRVPLSKGGAHSLENIAPSCKKCNSSKNNKLCPVGWGG
jgi:5-methylcytosine-specific restriction endonuclease McrA